MYLVIVIVKHGNEEDEIVERKRREACGRIKQQ